MGSPRVSELPIVKNTKNKSHNTAGNPTREAMQLIHTTMHKEQVYIVTLPEKNKIRQQVVKFGFAPMMHT